MSDDVVASNSRRDVKMDFQQYIAVNFCHPYNRDFNKVLYCFSKFIPTIDIRQIDEELAKLYLLSTGQTEDPQKFLGTNIGTIRVWVASSIANWITTMVTTFDRTRPMDPSKYYQKSTTFYSDTVDLGYTLKMPPELRTQIGELIKISKEGNLDNLIFREQLQYKLEATKLSLCSAYKRHDAIMAEYLSGHCPKDTSQSIGETLLIKDIVTPLLTLIDITPVIPQETGEFYQEMEKRYCSCKLKIYGLIFEILSGLRSTWSEEPHGRDPYGYSTWDHDPMRSKSKMTGWDAWIDHLPSCRPEFVVTLANIQQFTYQGKHNDPVRPTQDAVEFLKSLYLISGSNC